MDRQIEFRSLLIQILDNLSSEDRSRFLFVLGDVIPRIQRENVTISGTLTAIETLFDRAKINEQDFDYLIYAFQKIRCYNAVNRLKEFGRFSEPTKVNSSSFSDVLDDNSEYDKCATVDNSVVSGEICYTKYNNHSNDSNSVSINKHKILEKNTREPLSAISEIQITNDESSKNTITKRTYGIFFKSPFLSLLYIFFGLQMFTLIIYLIWILISRRASSNNVLKPIRREAYILKSGSYLNQTIGDWLDHSTNLSLTFEDRLIGINAYQHNYNMSAIEFIYSNNKTKKYMLRNFRKLNHLTPSTFNFEKKSLQEIAQCYRNNSGFIYLVGLDFTLGDDTHKYFGSCPAEINPKKDRFSDHVFIYVTVKITEYLEGFQFIWYEICPLNKKIISCG